MRIVQRHILINTRSWRCTKAAIAEIENAIRAIHWPPGAGDFAIYPESGKKRGQGNGVVPIRQAFVDVLRDTGWTSEMPFPLEGIKNGARFGAMDAAKSYGRQPPFIAEWETGNISSSHRSMNKMAIGLVEGVIAGGVLVVPTRALADYLTDRVGNVRELEPYFPLWSSVDVARGYLAVIAVQYDRTSYGVERIAKTTSGRALQ